MNETNFIINPPAYYWQCHGEIKEINDMLSRLSKKIDLFNYTFDIRCISITPIIAPDDAIQSPEFYEKTLICMDRGIANISLYSSYYDFCHGDLQKKKEIIVENIIASVKLVKNKTVEYFDFEKFERDIWRISAFEK